MGANPPVRSDPGWSRTPALEEGVQPGQAARAPLLGATPWADTARRGTTGLSIAANARPSLQGGRLPFGAPQGSRLGVGLRAHAEPSVLPRRQASSPWSHQHPQERPALFPGK